MLFQKKIIKIVSMLICVSVIAMCLNGCNDQTKNSELELQYYNQAKSYIDKGEIEKAKGIIDEGVQKFGESKLLLALLDGVEENETNSESESDSYAVPDLKGLSVDEAVEKLYSLNLSALVYYEESNDVPEGTVIYSDPSAGTPIDDIEPGEDGCGSVVLYVACPPEEADVDSRITAIDASFTFTEQLYPAHISSEASFCEEPYVEDGYLVLSFVYSSSDPLNWSKVATVSVENQVVGASIISDSYRVEEYTPYYFTIKVPVSNLRNPCPYYLSINFPVGSGHNMRINVTIVW
ncbi:MAG: PASTA domain-containing protein [Acutalibacteraceae bacterium]